jgi:hypothetical protein
LVTPGVFGDLGGVTSGHRGVESVAGLRTVLIDQKRGREGRIGRD